MKIDIFGVFSLYQRVILQTAYKDKYKILFENCDSQHDKNYYYNQYTLHSEILSQLYGVLNDLGLKDNYNRFVSSVDGLEFYNSCCKFIDD